MNYVKPEDIKEYVSKNPTGIAGMSEELSAMVNHFAELIVKETLQVARAGMEFGDGMEASVYKYFGVEE